MTENEILARWLGKDFAKWKGVSGIEYSELPDFRTSNEWAGALLENLKDYLPELYFDGGHWKLRINAKVSLPVVMSKSWRDAVVDAALEIARSEVNGGADHEP